MSQLRVSAETSEADAGGPVEFLIVEFPAGRMSAVGFDMLLDLVEGDVIRVLDLEFVARAPDGRVAQVNVADAVADAQGDVSAFSGWVAVLSSAVRRGGARVVSTGHIPLGELDAALGEEQA